MRKTYQNIHNAGWVCGCSFIDVAEDKRGGDKQGCCGETFMGGLGAANYETCENVEVWCCGISESFKNNLESDVR